MKTIISIKRNWLFVMALLMTFAIMSCEKNDGGGNPVIHYVRVTDPALVDSTFTDVQPGQMIAIIGENFNNLKKVYINDQDIPFNVNLTTSSSIIVTVPAELPLTGANPELKGEIRVVTDNGVCSYSMHVLSPAPAIKRLVINYPAVPGQTMKVLGSSFVEIERIYFTTENPADLEEEVTPTRAATEIDVKDYTVNADFTELSFAIPQGIFDFGYLVIQCYTDKAVSEFYKDLPVPVATKISSDMPVVGSEVYITGSNFIAVTSVNVNDQYTILAADLTVSESFDTIRFVMPKAPTKTGKISVVTLGGVAEIKEPFYPLSNVILDYDGRGSFSWGEAQSLVATASEAPFVSTGTCYSIKGKPGAWQYWWGNAVNNAALPATDVVPGTTPIADLELRFECYVSYPLEKVIFEYVLCSDWDHKYGDFVPTDRMTGTTTLGRWFTCSTPLSKFTAASVYQGLLDKNNSELGLYTKNPSENANTVVEMFFDNFRIVKVK